MIKPEDIVPLMRLEWIKGDKIGQTEIVDNVDTQGDFTWINFKGGGRINGHTINEFMILIGVVSQEDIEKEVISKIKNDELYSITETNKSEQTIQSDNTENAFVFNILEKAKKDSNMELNFSINFPFISENKINMLIELYGDDLFDALKGYIRLQLSDKIINMCIEEFLHKKFEIAENDKD